MIQQCFERSDVYASNWEWLFLNHSWNKSFKHSRNLWLKDRSRRSWLQSTWVLWIERDQKIEMKVFNWFEKMMTLICIFSNISFLFIHDFSNMTSWWLMSAINIETVNFLWLSMMRFNRILWVIVFLNIFSSYSFINFSFVSDIDWILSSLHTLSTRLICMIV